MGDGKLGFCNLELIRFKRLEFGTMNLWRDYDSKQQKLPCGRFVIEVHIPSDGPLNHAECLETYVMAEAYYRKKYQSIFHNEPIPFFVATWFLYPPMKEVLEEGSNLLQFVNDYEVIFENPQNNDGELWRIYGTDYQIDTAQLPERTSLQKISNHGC